MTDTNNTLYLIFDMDGTLIDSNPTHREAYTQFFARHGIKISDDDFTQHISGRINTEIMTFFFGQKGKKLTDKQIEELVVEKETLFQQLYSPIIRPIAGLPGFLMAVKAAGIPMALATSAPLLNVDFVFDKLGIRQFFQHVITDGDVPKGKPDPAVFRIAADRMGADPVRCLVFEDSAKGVEAAQHAGMKVIALKTSHEPEATEKADLVIDAYTQIKVDQLSGMLT
ncbi:HAD family hydrolase [Fibrella forsythiae]|uniref:HAD family phosphatase n=1 Tax=Fibrella forsythiae TaxID=2817061 RepID=A0ABS3JCA3_9BACT|nr:HAD family phosphatase [Fibrella forsythiae]MBO0947635.1 HAD family phosphatase [Fibrella forsythiae]